MKFRRGVWDPKQRSIRCHILSFALLASILTGLAPAAETAPWRAPAWVDFLAHGPTEGYLPEFGYAGYHRGEDDPPRAPATVRVTDFGAKPDDDLDDTVGIQAAIRAVEGHGGGIVEFPRGRFVLNSGSDPKAYGLQISQSGVVLRGAGQGSTGTILVQMHTKLGIPSGSGAESALIQVGISDKLGPEIAVVKDAKRGAYEVSVADSSVCKVGQILRLSLQDPGLDSVHPRASASELAAQTVSPFVLTDDLDVFLRYSATGKFQMLLEVAAIPSPTAVRFTIPLRQDILAKWRPRLQVFNTLRQVGIESLRLVSSWKGGFAHHKPFPIDAKGDYVKGGPGVIRSAQEQNYSWSAVLFNRVAHGWIRDVTTVDYTQDITASFAKNLSLTGIRVEGQAGHCAVTLSRASDCLIKGVVISAPRVHAFFVSGFSTGNVFTRAELQYGPFDPVSETDTCLDFHGLAPAENLYDSIDRAYVYPGGSPAYLPHAGQRNVFWNIRAPEKMLRGGNSGEFFRTYAKTSTGGRNTAFEHWPKAFVIGVYRDGAPITIGGQADDRADAWLTVQGLNRPGVEPSSLYEAQHARLYPHSTSKP